MSSSNSNWRQSAAAIGSSSTADRRANLAMTAELALGSQPMPSYGAGVGSTVVPRQRGGGAGATTSNDSKDFLGSLMNKPPLGTSNKANNILSNDFDQSAKNSISGRFYSNNPNSDFNPSMNSLTSAAHTSTTIQAPNSLMQNNNITNMYSKPSSINIDTLAYFNSNNVTSRPIDPDSSQGFKVQRVRGGNQVQSNILALNGGNSTNNINSINGLKDENIDSQTWQVKREIDSLDAKLSSKQQNQQETSEFRSSQQVAASITFNNGFGLNATNGGTKKNLQQQNQENTAYSGFSSNTNSAQLRMSQQSQQQQKQQQKEDDSIAITTSGPFKKMLSNPVLMATSGATKSNEIANATKEFQTGTYDPSNILGGTRQGRMRSLGRGKEKPSANQHEEKAAQATGNKLLPEEVAVESQFECPEGCGRSFNKKALEKHIPLCKKVFVPKKSTQVEITTSNAPVTLMKKAGSIATKNQQKKDNPTQKLPPKQPSQSQSKKETVATSGALKAAEQGVQAAKNEALRKLKEQKKKEIAEATKANQNQRIEDDRNIIDDNQNDQDYF